MGREGTRAVNVKSFRCAGPGTSNRKEQCSASIILSLECGLITVKAMIYLDFEQFVVSK